MREVAVVSFAQTPYVRRERGRSEVEMLLPVIGQAIEVFSAALPILVYPLFSCILTLMYYDLRVRREAFDLQILGQQLGIT